jgi:Tfp pilus assembly protein PilV
VGTLLIATFVLLVIVTGGLAFASYRRHTRAAQARSRAALNVLLAEAYELSEAKPEVDRDGTELDPEPPADT